MFKAPTRVRHVAHETKGKHSHPLHGVVHVNLALHDQTWVYPRIPLPFVREGRMARSVCCYMAGGKEHCYRRLSGIEFLSPYP
jgi:hypothetical protein